MSRLDRFHRAQSAAGAGFAEALGEIRAGGKRGHWIWYVLPQLRGLGSSPAAREYGLADREEAADYLRDPELRARFVAMVSAIDERLAAGHSLRALMGSEIDARKTVSSLTLFGEVARAMEGPPATGPLEPLIALTDRVLDRAAAEGLPRCEWTLRALRADS